MKTSQNYLKMIVFAVAVVVIVSAVIFTKPSFLQKYFSGEPTSKESSLPQVYKNTLMGFSIRLPEGYKTDESYSYQALGPGKEISGVKFAIPNSVAAGTNLADDSYISVEEIPRVSECSAKLFTYPEVKANTVTEDGTTYSAATSSDAGLGNRYEETVYAISGTNPCVAVRYFIHYSVFENYPAGMVKNFDKQALLDQFDKIRKTLVVNQ